MKKFTFLLIFFFCHFCNAQISQVTDTVVITGLTNPIHLAHANDGSNRFFIAEKGGRVKVFNSQYQLKDTLVNITNVGTANEEGLLSIAFHPRFRDSSYVYLYYVDDTSNLKIDRFAINPLDTNSVLMSSRKNILKILHLGQTNHNGGEMHFGRDGYLYLSTGDGGGGNDPNSNGQNTSTLLGKLLRIDVDNPQSGFNYGIPSDNPFGNLNYCIGLRNPFRWSFDRTTGDIYIGDVGQNAKEEVDFVPKDSIAKTNFGWRCFEGDTSIITPCTLASGTTHRKPIYVYPITSGNRSVVGGNVYRGYKYPDMVGTYFFLDYFSSRLRSLKRINNVWRDSIKLLPNSYSGVSDIGEGEDGELYIVDLSSGSVARLKHTNAKEVYVFTGNGNWSNPLNWLNGIKPTSPSSSNAVIAISPINGGQCILDEDHIINPGGDFKVDPGSLFILNAKLTVD